MLLPILLSTGLGFGPILYGQRREGLRTTPTLDTSSHCKRPLLDLFVPLPAMAPTAQKRKGGLLQNTDDYNYVYKKFLDGDFTQDTTPTQIWTENADKAKHYEDTYSRNAFGTSIRNIKQRVKIDLLGGKGFHLPRRPLEFCEPNTDRRLFRTIDVTRDHILSRC